jgi:hypothetical protein
VNEWEGEEHKPAHHGHHWESVMVRDNESAVKYNRRLLGLGPQSQGTESYL